MTDLQTKIRDVFAEPQVSSLATVTEDGKPWVRYVTVSADDTLTLRVATFLGSRKVAHIRKNPDVHLTAGAWGMSNAERYLQIQATATVSTDAEERHSIWNDNLRAYFSGPDDPNFAVLIMRPYRIEYQIMTSMTPEVWEA
jgi:general stress protein 26